MKIYEKEGLLLYAQIDHLSGEILGSVIGCLYDAGAANVQVIPTVTKKNRPGYIILIDVRPDHADTVERVMIRELQTGGWHRISTAHRHLDVEYAQRQVMIRWQEKTIPLNLQIKTIAGEQQTIRPEHDCCVQLKKLLQDAGLILPLTECIRILETIIEQKLGYYEIKEQTRYEQ